MFIISNQIKDNLYKIVKSNFQTPMIIRIGDRVKQIWKKVLNVAHMD